MQKVSETLRAILAEHRCRLQQVSTESGIQYATLWRFCHSERWIWSDTLDRLVLHFGLTLVDGRFLEGLQAEIRGLHAIIDAHKTHTQGTKQAKRPAAMSNAKKAGVMSTVKALPATGLHRRLVWVRGTCEGTCARRRQVCGRCRRCADCGHSTSCESRGVRP